MGSVSSCCCGCFRGKCKSYDVDNPTERVESDIPYTRFPGKTGITEYTRNAQTSHIQNQQKCRQADSDTVKALQQQIDSLRDEKSVLENKLYISTANEDRLRHQLADKEQENEELLMRLSKIASANLTDNNPNIADLSDLNRPTKIAERFSELYDNEWTNAFEDLHDTHGLLEEDTIHKLFNIEKEIFHRCRQYAAKDLNELKSTIQQFIGMKEFPEEMATSLKAYKDGRKRNFQAFLEHLEQEMVTVCEAITQFGYEETPKVQAYVKTSTELCWLMAIQDPPLAMVTACEDGDRFDGNLYKSYTTNGTHVAYLVWPALYLHDDGPLLSKGVAQGKKDRTSSPTVLIQVGEDSGANDFRPTREDKENKSSIGAVQVQNVNDNSEVNYESHVASGEDNSIVNNNDDLKIQSQKTSTNKRVGSVSDDSNNKDAWAVYDDSLEPTDIDIRM